MAAVLDQQGCEIELIVVDDGSPAAVEDTLADIEDARLQVQRVEHRGVSEARNAGIRAARGEFLRFVDADDVLERGSTARLLRVAADGGMIAYGDTVICDDELRPVGIKRSRLDGWIAKQCLLYRFDATHISMLFPRRVVEATGGWEPTMRQCEDWDFVLRALEHAPARSDPGIAAYRRRHHASLSSDLAGSLHHESRVVDRYFERHPEQTGTKLERAARAKLLMIRARACPALGKTRSEQLGLIARALALDPRATEEIGHEVFQLGRRAFTKLRG